MKTKKTEKISFGIISFNRYINFETMNIISSYDKKINHLKHLFEWKFYFNQNLIVYVIMHY